MSNQKKISVDELLLAEGQKQADKLIIGVLFFILTVIPLITRAVVLEHWSPFIVDSSLDSGRKGDVFTYYKFIWLTMSVIFIWGVFLYKMLVKGYRIPKSYINVPLFIMAFFIIFSGMFADYKTIAFFGQYNRHDGTLTYLLYLSLFFIAANVVYDLKRARKIIYFLYPVVVLNAVLGVLGFYGVELLQSSLIKMLILPSSISEGAVNAGSRLATTINNPNYVSGLGGMLTVLFMAVAILSQERKQQILHGTFAVISFVMLLTATSTSGFLTLVIMFPVVVALIFWSISRKRSVITLLSLCVFFAGAFGILNSHNKKVWDESFGFFFGSSEQQLSFQTSEQVDLDDITEKYNVFVTPSAHAEERKETVDEFNLPPAAWGPGTGRLYIWDKTMELIKQNPFLGHGLDTLAYYFPQNDPNKNANLNDSKTIVDKPHNMYLGIAYGAGVFALIGFLWMIIGHIRAHISLFKSKFTGEREVIIASLFVGWLSYLLQALFNDSIIGTAPLFWILFGVSVSLLHHRISVE